MGQGEDLKKEIRILQSLERVREASFALQNSGELNRIIATVFQELKKLGFETVECEIIVFDPEKRDCRIWASNEAEQLLPGSYHIPYNKNKFYQFLLESWQSGQDYCPYELKGTTKKAWENWLFTQTDWKNIPEAVQESMRAAKKVFIYGATFAHGILEVGSLRKLEAEQFELIKRFAKVFEQAYTRFLDLKKLEAQAREAQIEAALERVRAASMAMHQSEQLSGTAQVLYEQFRLLGENPEQLTIGVVNEEERVLEVWLSTKESQRNRMYKASLDEPIVVNKIYWAWRNQKETLHLDISGEELKKYQAYRKSDPEFSQYITYKERSNQENRRVIDVVLFSNGILSLAAQKPQTEDTIRILKRFAAVFEIAYTRFLDIQKAEAQAREALKEASLDRVRAEIASMRTTQDLEKITPLIWKELIALEVPFFRCGVFIMDEVEELVKTYLTTPEDDSLAALDIPFGKVNLIDEMVEYWKKQSVYTQRWDRAEFIQFTQSILQQGLLEDADQYRGGEAPPEKLALHFVPFSQGMLYVGSEELLSEDQLDLVKALATAFSIAYSRYEDFNKLEKAKTNLEHTLAELQAAQAQLIQSEKMASLGELTAGIAHEIQNPLNFVNNFSEVSSELLAELQEELDHGDTDEAKEILQDISQNLEKIHHHGGRASGIVKSMLDHSRTSSGEKVKTDINALCDEYLRLAYHGIRAKDRRFHAELESTFDESIPKVKVVSQDIGRVLLNLINNAFQALKEVDDSTKLPGQDPKVVVSTKNLGDTLEIRISDNGPGIPDDIKDKIFQPFFTTKPTGQGTGLGLSLSYDIVKAHGGTIDLKTQPGEGTTFIIHLPLNQG